MVDGMQRGKNKVDDTISFTKETGCNELKSFAMHELKATDSSPNPPEQVLFTESMIVDYVTLKGIENRFGIKEDDIPVSIFKELVDNALDCVETLVLTNAKLIPEVDVQITSNDDRTTLIVSNSDKIPSFTFERIRSLFNYHNLASTKRNQHKISRGALGNGLKAILGMSYALATEVYNCDGWTPLRIRTGNKQYSVHLIIDKINKLHKPISLDVNEDKCISGENTSVEIDIPTNSKTCTKFIDTFRDFTVLNPHVTMRLNVNGKRYSFPQVQKIKSDWNNLDSIYHYSEKEFENLILSTATNNMTIYDFVTSIRLTEASKLSKQGWNIPVSEAQNDKTLVRKLYGELKKLLGAKEKLDIPYDMRIRPRKDAITKRLAQWGIEVESIKYEFYNGPCSANHGEGEVRFPYFFEVAEIKTISHKHEIISGINSSPANLESMDNPLKFEWISKGKKWNTDWLRIILEEDCGYSRDSRKFKKPNSIVFMHLVSPRIDWEGYGKSQIDFNPFPNLGTITYDVCKGGIRESHANKVTQRGILTEFLIQRQKDIQKDQSLIVTDRWNPSDVWYGCRPELLKNGIKITTNTRSNFTALIRTVCDEHLHINMEDLGIFAADRAQLYFQGHWYDVGFDEIHSLKLKGTDLIIIEKEGITEGGAPYADKVGIALLFTRGFATKYVRDLSELSISSGCNVVVLSDYDDSGLLLASKVKVPRLGIDPETLEYFNLKRRDVEERYTPKNHLNSIESLVNEQEFEYLSGKRIEINSVKTKVGTDRFWEWIILKLEEIFPSRNYNRVLKVPKLVKPEDLLKAYSKIEDKLEKCIESRCAKEVEALTYIEGFIPDVQTKQMEIEQELKKELTDNPKCRDFFHELNEFINSHHFLNDGEMDSD